MCLFDVLGLKLLVLTHTVTVFSTSVSSGQTSCSKDWFGPTCQYQCHCAGSAPCDKHDGSCSSGCHQDWFGPACQYARMGFTVNGNFNSSWLTDNNDTTCNRENLRSVTVTLDTAIPLTWLRVVVSDAVDFKTVEISYRSKSSNTQCPESNFVEINKVTADFSCPTEYPVTNVTLSGLGNSLLCSLYINAGRNVALKQPAEQSSLYEDKANKDAFVAQNAVDGEIPKNSKASRQLTCTHTKSEKRSWWQVSFTNHVEITRFVIENRRDCCKWRLNNFSLTVFPPNGSYPSRSFRDPGRNQITYTIVPSPRISFPVKHVNITEGFNKERILTLCEVFIFGGKLNVFLTRL
ncbi:hypothetical protein RRG08_055853 [Elysia crispata]|uniref:Fucolectin tachylectin-4 pentraxin-1 domain-containing protein n=1 Tax=Elysia crispata TaxID=231223 RepID=A0AAE1CRL4_9GAST|nr:hypothetical protein RRG08_055853 [Elysia crispata]